VATGLALEVKFMESIAKRPYLENHRLNPCYNIGIMAEKKESPAGSSFWQIIFPAIAGTILILLVCVWVASGVGPGNISRFAELDKIRDGASRVSKIIVQPVIQPSAYLKGFKSIFSREKSRYRIE
jgi:hypothetical protein